MNFEPFTFLFERFTDFLTNQINFFCTDEVEEIKSLQDEVVIAHNALEDVDEVQRQADIHRELQTNVRKVMAILGEIEDFLHSRIEEKDGSFFSVGTLKRKRSAVKRAREIREKLNDAVQCLKGYKLTGDSPHVILRQRYQTQPDNFKEEFIVGLKDDVATYIAELVNEAGHGRSTDVAIFGMGGAGKTTAARLVYNHNQIFEHFDKCAWVCVSQQWDKNQLLRQICHQVGVPSPKGNEILVSKLRHFLGKHSCFFVLDDVWDVKALLELLPILRRSRNRVLVTTRNKEILNFPQNDFSTKKIRPLTPEESWDLFSKTIRRNRRDGWNLEGGFVQLGKEMLEKCGGLPLAIVALGGLLSSKDTVQEWESIKADVVRRISRHKGSYEDYRVVTEILELSYFDLPYCLKPCFIYLGIFPEDCNIPVERIIQLWIAEGFVKVDQSSRSKTLEKVARDYLDELAHRCMVEIVKKDNGGELAYIRIHDLMRDLCIRKAEDWKLFELLPAPTSASTSMDQNSSRIILHKELKTLPFNINNLVLQRLRLRTYIMFDYPTMSSGPGSQAEINLALKQMQYLRVLCLKRVDLRKTGAEICDLILLRHLELKECLVSMENLLSIKKLRNLHSFIYEPCYDGNRMMVENMGGGMQQLRHLCILWVDAVAELGVGNKYKLQTLKAPGGEWLTKELQDASIDLQELSLDCIQNSAQLEAVYDFVSNRCQHLHMLSLALSNSRLEFELHKLSTFIQCASLHLSGKIKRQPPQQPFGRFPPRLLKLCLKDTEIGEEEQLKEALAQLDELRYLILGKAAYTVNRLTMIGLQKLQELHLQGISNLKEWRIENGALSKLEKLKIMDCEKLEKLPRGIRRISSLKHLEVEGMPWRFVRRLERPSESGSVEGEDFFLISHIPSFQVTSTVDRS